MLRKIPFQSGAGQTATAFTGGNAHSYAGSMTVLKSVRVFAITATSLSVYIYEQTDRCPVNFIAAMTVDFGAMGKGASNIFNVSGLGFQPVELLTFNEGTHYYDDWRMDVTAPSENITLSLTVRVQPEWGFITGTPITFYQEMATRTWSISWRLLIRGWYSYTD